MTGNAIAETLGFAGSEYFRDYCAICRRDAVPRDEGNRILSRQVSKRCAIARTKQPESGGPNSRKQEPERWCCLVAATVMARSQQVYGSGGEPPSAAGIRWQRSVQPLNRPELRGLKSVACGSPPRRAYRPHGAVAEWLKAAGC